jgi:nucleoid DNA-binding protein
LNRKELVDSIQKHTSVARADVDKVLGSLIQHTQVAVKKGERVRWSASGPSSGRTARPAPPATRVAARPVKVKATKVPRFRAGTGLQGRRGWQGDRAQALPGEVDRQGTTAKGGQQPPRRAPPGASSAKASSAKASTSRAAGREQRRQEHGQGRQLAGKAKSGKKK